MLQTFNKIRTRGFTLIELLVVIAIIGLLSTIIAAPIQNARKKARDAKKIAELKSMQLAIEQYAEANDSNYPGTLVQLSPSYMPLLPTFAASTTSTSRDAYAYAVYAANASGGATSTYSFHLGSKLEVYGPALDTDRDCAEQVLGAALLDPFCSVFNGDTASSTMLDNGTSIQSSTTANGTDFEGWREVFVDETAANRDEIATSTCKSINDCIFDITSQQ